MRSCAIGNSTGSIRKRITTPPPKKSSKKTLAPVPNKIPRTLLFVRQTDALFQYRAEVFEWAFLSFSLTKMKPDLWKSSGSTTTGVVLR